MAKKDAKLQSEIIAKLLGGKDNIKSITNCMTRLRVTVASKTKVDLNKIKRTEHVMGLVEAGKEIQIILGPGFVRKVAEAMSKQLNIEYGGEVDENIELSSSQSLADVAASKKAQMKEKQTSEIQQFLSKIAKIFSPLIFGFIGAGILAGLGGILESAFTETINGNRVWINDVAFSFAKVFAVMLDMWKNAFIIIVGWRTAEVFGGSGVVGGLSAGIFVASFSGVYTAPFVAQTTTGGEHYLNFLGIKIFDPSTHWLTIGFRASGDATTGWTLGYASGGIFGAMILSGIGVPIEKKIRSVMPDSIDIVGSSTLTYLALTFLAYFLVIPVSGLMFEVVNQMFSSLYKNPAGAALLAFIFLLAVTFGIHQGFVPIYAILLADTGINGLFPVLAMAGAGQVGVAIATYLKCEDESVLKNQIKGAIIPGFLGIGEPLIYAMALPRPKLFIAGMIGGGVGGFYMGALNTWAELDIGLNTMFGPSGLLAAPLMTTPAGQVGLAIPVYLSALLVSYSSGFLATKAIGFKGVDLT